MLRGSSVAILAEEGFDDLELVESLRAMKDMNARVFIVGSGKLKTQEGKWPVSSVRTDLGAHEITVQGLDAVIIPGANVPKKMLSDQAILKLLQNADRNKKIIAAISKGPLLLASAGLVKGKRLTSSPAIAADLITAGATWVNAPVVHDGNLITSRKPADIPKFTKELIHALAR